MLLKLALISSVQSGALLHLSRFRAEAQRTQSEFLSAASAPLREISLYFLVHAETQR